MSLGLLTKVLRLVRESCPVHNYEPQKVPFITRGLQNRWQRSSSVKWLLVGKRIV